MNWPASKRRGVLLGLRVGWLVLLTGQVVLLITVVVRDYVWPVAADLVALQHNRSWVTALFVWSAVVVLAAYYFRGQTYKRAWRGQAIQPWGYGTGQGLLLLTCAAASVLGLLVGWVHHTLWPTACLSVGLMAFQAINFPNGRAMLPACPREHRGVGS